MTPKTLGDENLTSMLLITKLISFVKVWPKSKKVAPLVDFSRNVTEFDEDGGGGVGCLEVSSCVAMV